MKIPCNFKVRSTGSCETVRTGLWRRPDAPQCLEASALQPSGRPSNTVQTLSQATPSSTQSWISVDTVCEVSARRPDDVATRLDATQYSKIFWVRHLKPQLKTLKLKIRVLGFTLISHQAKTRCLEMATIPQENQIPKEHWDIKLNPLKIYKKSKGTRVFGFTSNQTVKT
jgi:hypothetical protein